MSDQPIPTLSNSERASLARVPAEFCEVNEPDREMLRRLQRKKLVQVRTLTPELHRDEYVKVEWKLTALGQKALGP